VNIKICNTKQLFVVLTSNTTNCDEIIIDTNYIFIIFVSVVKILSMELVLPVLEEVKVSLSWLRKYNKYIIILNKTGFGIVL